MRNKANLGIHVSCLNVVVIIVSLFSSCAGETNIIDGNNNKLLSFSVSVPSWKSNDSISSSKDSRATPITETSLGTSNTFNLIADENDGSGNYSTLIDNKPVSYSNNLWKTKTDYYWSGTSSKTINFYAYYSTSAINGILNHTAGSAPTLTYTVPDDVANQHDIIVATKSLTEDANSAVDLSFNHIFAAVKFSVGTSGMPPGTITKITLNNIQYTGTYSFDGTWTPNTTDLHSFSQIVSASSNAGTVITSGETTFMMMPQTLNSSASITVTYSNGGTLTKVISGTWAAGNTYTYNISKNISQSFDYTGAVQTFTVPLTGTYKIECWGAQGGGSSSTIGGKGAYVYGNIKLTKGDMLYVYVGEKGDFFDTSVPLRTETYNSTKGDVVLFTLGRTGHVIFNNGGESVSISVGSSSSNQRWAYAGGGSTDVRLTNGIWNDFSSLKTRIMVAASGSGACTYGYLNGVNAGSLLGLSGTGSGSAGNNATGGGQNQGGLHGTGNHMYPNSPRAGFGYTSYNYVTTSGGGNGYYAGGNGNHGNGTVGSGASGSSFISGYSGCNAISSSSTSTNIVHTGSPNHYSGYVFTNSTMIAGNASMPAPSGGTETGHSGNGYARITFVSAD